MLALYKKSGWSVAYIKSKIAADNIGLLLKPRAVLNACQSPLQVAVAIAVEVYCTDKNSLICDDWLVIHVVGIPIALIHRRWGEHRMAGRRKVYNMWWQTGHRPKSKLSLIETNAAIWLTNTVVNCIIPQGGWQALNYRLIITIGSNIPIMAHDGYHAANSDLTAILWIV